jgi:hypothetical protein
MSIVLTACVLVRLDARMGTWVPVADLASHFACGRHFVCAHLEAMAADDLVQVHRDGSTGAITEAAVMRRQRGAGLGLEVVR